jgi:hypothetical protein
MAKPNKSYTYIAAGYINRTHLMKVGKTNNLPRRSRQIGLPIELSSQVLTETGAFQFEAQLRNFVIAQGGIRYKRTLDWFLFDACIYHLLSHHFSAQVTTEFWETLSPDEEIELYRRRYAQLLKDELQRERYEALATLRAERDTAYTEAMHKLTQPKQGLDERLRGNHGRFPTLAAKLALILSVMDWVEDGAKDAPRVTEVHWAGAQMLTEDYRASAHRLIAQLNISQDTKNEQKILDFIRRTQSEKPPTKREIHRGTAIRHRTDAYASVDALLTSGVIVEVERSNIDGNGGRPTKGYKLAKP